MWQSAGWSICSVRRNVFLVLYRCIEWRKNGRKLGEGKNYKVKIKQQKKAVHYVGNKRPGVSESDILVLYVKLAEINK